VCRIGRQTVLDHGCAKSYTNRMRYPQTMAAKETGLARFINDTRKLLCVRQRHIFGNGRSARNNRCHICNNGHIRQTLHHCAQAQEACQIHERRPRGCTVLSQRMHSLCKYSRKFCQDFQESRHIGTAKYTSWDPQSCSRCCEVVSIGGHKCSSARQDVLQPSMERGECLGKGSLLAPLAAQQAQHGTSSAPLVELAKQLAASAGTALVRT